MVIIFSLFSSKLLDCAIFAYKPNSSNFVLKITQKNMLVGTLCEFWFPYVYI